jgi:transcriptional regulator of acetoin/glycerol metabolism
VLGANAQQALLAHGWPGNVRELQNRLQRARLVASGAEITPDDLGLAPNAIVDAGAAAAGGMERQALEGILREHGGSVSRTAGALGLSRQALYRRMERLGITLERRPRS